MTVASETRDAVRSYPFLYTALRADIVNFTAAARFLDIGETDAVAAALRRYGEELGTYERTPHRVSVSMQSGITQTDAGDGLLCVGGKTFIAADGDHTAVIGVGDIDISGLEAVLGRFRTAEINVTAAAGAKSYLVVIVDRRSGPDAVRIVEDALKN